MEKNKLLKVINEISPIFPFKNYLNDNGIIRPKYFYIYKLIKNKFSGSETILDFGSGLNDLSAILKKLNFNIEAYDDCNDDWYKIDKNLEKLRTFSNQINLKFYENIQELFKSKKKYEIILLLDVLEHVPTPKKFIYDVINFLEQNSYIIITVPNSVSLRKRISVFFGKTNYASYSEYFEEEPFRGHWREYSLDDILYLAKKINFEIKHLEGINAIVPRNKFLFFIYIKFKFLYNYLIKIFPSLSDTICVILKKN
ncbi:class I SAM-dependent methyltransferase [Candidatus Pelagibacter communis]|uniref:class I SAM-dependent methyltransferase n=1 Tax=Pelagibacter ubique TaxID=198252 RepID=UPI00065B348A|nr:class I SAM-dependent methyltransferase [Candidatus Pelagibacter ubique]